MNPYDGPLDSITYEEVREWIEAITLENQRLEIKSKYDANAIARAVAAFANAIGGIIVIGFEDPVPGAPLVEAPIASIDDRVRRAMMSQIQARINPGLAVEICGYERADATHRCWVIRVPTSAVAPHELLHDRGRLPVRRGSQIDHLTLAEIEQLILRRDGAPRITPPGREAGSWINIDPYTSGWFFGIRVHSESFVQERVLTQSLEREIESAIKSLPGLAIDSKTMADGVLFFDENDTSLKLTRCGLNRVVHLNRAYVDQRAMIEIRLPQDTEHIWYQMVRIWANAIAAAALVFPILGAGPRLSGQFNYNIFGDHNERRGLPEMGRHAFRADLSRETFEQIVREPILYELRVGGQAAEPDEIAKTFGQIWNERYACRSPLSDTRALW